MEPCGDTFRVPFAGDSQEDMGKSLYGGRTLEEDKGGREGEEERKKESSETSDSNRNASQLLHAARRAIRNIYKEAENVRVQIKNGGASDEVLNQTPFYCPCDPGQKALLQQAMSELRDLLTMHQDRRKGESEQRLNRALINIGDLYRAEQLENSLAKALEQTRKVLNRRCEYLIAEKKGKGSLEIHKMIQDLHQEEDESLSVVLAHTTSEEDNFFFAAEITLLCVDPEEGKTRNLLKDAPESELKVVEAKMTSYMGGEDEVTCADSDKDLENTLRKRSLDVLRHKLSLCIENQRFLFENKDHESGGKTLPNEGSIVFDRMQQHRASHPKQILKVHRFLEGPSMCIMSAAPLQPIYLRQNVGGGYYGTYLRSVCDELSLVFIRSAPPAPPTITTGGGDRSSSSGSGGSQFGYAFEIRPAILTSLPAGMEISTMAGVSHVQYHAILFNDQNQHAPAAGFSRAATAAKTTTTRRRTRRTTTATASASSTSAMNIDDSSGGYSVNGASSSPPAYPGLHEILGFRGQGERKYDLFGQTQVWKLRNRTPQRQTNSNQESKISRAGGGNLMALGIDRIYVRSMDDVFALIPMLQRETHSRRRTVPVRFGRFFATETWVAAAC
eukprot:jgi/Bigna1/70647/fgenesh1_pg.12_\